MTGVEMFYDNGVIRIYEIDAPVGAPCLEIPADAETLARWAYLLLRYAQDEASDPEEALGRFGTLQEVP